MGHKCINCIYAPFFIFADSELMSEPAAATATNCRYH